MKYFVKFSNRKTHDSFISNLKDVIVIMAQVWGLLSFYNTSSKGSVFYPLIYYSKKKLYMYMFGMQPPK